MKKKFIVHCSLFILFLSCARQSTQQTDWMINGDNYPAVITLSGEDIILSNGLINRIFRNGTTIGLNNLTTGEGLLRSVRPEAEVMIDNINIPVGGLTGQVIHNYLLPEWLENMTLSPLAFHYTGYDESPILKRFDWQPREEWISSNPAWPPKGKMLTLKFKADDMMIKALLSQNTSADGPNRLDYLRDIQLNVHYEIYDGIPLLCKWISVVNNSGKPIVLNTYKSEILAVTEPENAAIFNKSFITPNITIETDFAHCQKHDYVNPDFNRATQRHAHWNQDKLYMTQIDWLYKIPCLLESYPEYGPEMDIGQGETFESHRTWELIHDSWERERKTLQIRKMYRTAAPWVAENPIFMHVRRADNESVKKAVDQCAEVGFEMIIMTFGSGVNMENVSPENLERMKMLADYAHSKGIALGGYSLLASRSINKENDVVMPPGKTPMFDQSPCLGSEWGQQYLKNLQTYLTVTGQDLLEHDGSYPGDECASTTHPGHKGLGDSQWKQFQAIKNFYHWCKSQGIFLNIPDWYFMNGQNKTGMGYRETNWSLPREQQEIIERQNIYDGTWNKAPSMGWMMVPLVEYHGGGAAATIEPLKDHLPHYEMRLANNFGAGVIACYRGPQLYDTPETKAVVKKWVDIYKAHRAIFDSDIIHLRRPDGTDWDGFLHVNPQLKEKGLLMVYNPLNEPIKRKITVPLYYTGLTDKVTVIDRQNKKRNHTISREYTIEMEIDIPAKDCNWYILE